MGSRFIDCARTRGYHVWPALLGRRGVPCLLNVGSRRQAGLLDGSRRIVYRASGPYQREIVERFRNVYNDREFTSAHESGNRYIASALQQADFVIYQSTWAKRQLDRLHTRIDRTWQIIPNAVDLEIFRPLSGWSDRMARTARLITVGSLRYRPRLEVLFDVMKQIKIPAELTVVGPLDRHCENTKQRFLSDSALRGRVKFIPEVRPTELVALYQAADCLVHPVLGDVCPNVVVEAIACGLPVVCPAEGGTAEVVGPGGISVIDNEGVLGSAFRQAMTDAVEEIVDDLSSYKKAARQQAESFHDIEELTKAYIQALLEAN